MPPQENPSLQLLDALRNSYAQNKLALFVGAGLTLNITRDAEYKRFLTKRLPQWLPSCPTMNLYKHFQNNGAQTVEYCIYHKAMHTPDYPTDQHLAYRKGKQWFSCEVVREYFSDCRLHRISKPNEWSLHFDITRRFDIIFTTNWDRTIENACEYPLDGIHRPYLRYWQEGKELKYDDYMANTDTQPPPLRVYKFHGDIDPVLDRSESVVATERDLAERIREPGEMGRSLVSVAQSHRFLFIGYKLADPNVVSLLREIQSLKSKTEEGVTTKDQFILLSVEPEDRQADVCAIESCWAWARNIEILNLWQSLREAGTDPQGLSIRDAIRQLLRQITAPPANTGHT